MAVEAPDAADFLPRAADQQHAGFDAWLAAETMPREFDAIRPHRLYEHEHRRSGSLVEQWQEEMADGGEHSPAGTMVHAEDRRSGPADRPAAVSSDAREPV